jgi:hypothetical protein
MIVTFFPSLPWLPIIALFFRLLFDFAQCLPLFLTPFIIVTFFLSLSWLCLMIATFFFSYTDSAQ